MNKYLKIFFTLLAICFCSQTAHAVGLDEIYRDLVRDDNKGYLPIFVKNRNQPELLFEEDFIKTYPQAEVKDIPENKPVSLIDERKIREQQRLEELKRWKEAVKAVKENRVTPVELEEIDRYADNNDPKAVEIKAWMYARGIGVKQDLPEAFYLYQKAASLGVKNALQNAALVYKSMSRFQRENLTSFKK